jgi:curli biogenesis system outer membrane secretion channel CsgG
MRAKIPALLATLFATILASGAIGCAPTVHVTRLKPAEVNLHGVSRIAVGRIDNRDGENLSSLITQGLFDSKRFEVLDRSNLDKLIQEHGLDADSAFEGGGATLGKLLPATALVTGRVAQANYDEKLTRENHTCSRTVGSGDKRRVEKYACTYYVRKGQAKYVADMRVLDTSTSRILASRTLTKEHSDTNTAYDQEPASIDGDGMLDACRKEVAQSFLHMVAPYPVDESVKLAKDSHLPELATGNEFVKRGDWQKGIEFYGRAVARAESDTTLSPKAKGKAHYSLGLALAFTGDYDGGIAELEKAYLLGQDSSWLDMQTRVKQFKAEAKKVEEQMKDAQPQASSAP